MFLLSQACDSQIKIVPPLLSNTKKAPVIMQGRLTYYIKFVCCCNYDKYKNHARKSPSHFKGQWVVGLTCKIARWLSHVKIHVTC